MKSSIFFMKSTTFSIYDAAMKQLDPDKDQTSHLRHLCVNI